MSQKTKFLCRRCPSDKMHVEFLDHDGLGKEMYVRHEQGDSWRGSVVLNAEQAQELVRRINIHFGPAPRPEKLWVDL